jgi:hypothetical protein
MPKTNYLLSDEEYNDDDEEMDDLEINRSAALSGQREDHQSSRFVNSHQTESDAVVINKSKLALVAALLETIRESQEKISQLLSDSLDSLDNHRIGIGRTVETDASSKTTKEKDSGRIIEGVFDGENMIGPDGKQYSVPANYASKSKLVEGDILKLTITSKGTFLYKQIGPIERTRVIGELQQLENGSFLVISGSKEWKVLTASVTYYKGTDGDEIVILVPKIGESKWAAVENIVKKAV